MTDEFHPFNERGIQSFARPRAGVYCLRQYLSFPSVVYVGRSDTDVRGRLRDHLPENEQDPCISVKKPKFFYVEHTASAQDAYEAECRLYHHYGPECNNMHPGNKYGWSCPVCE